MDDNVRLLQGAEGVKGQQARITGTGADKPDPARLEGREVKGTAHGG
jgi:hypothetical protein